MKHPQTREEVPPKLAIAHLRANVVARVDPERARKILMEEGVPWREAGQRVLDSRTRWKQMAQELKLRGEAP